MSFTTDTKKSVSSFRVLVEMDILQENTQWVNAGAGIWYVNFENSYPEVDSSLLDGFTAQDIVDVGSVTSDALQLLRVYSLGAVTENYMSFFYDTVNKSLYISLDNYDDPILHEVNIGVVYGISKDEFTPVNAAQTYEGRLLNDFSIGTSRDPLFFGRITYPSVQIQAANNDGYFDEFARDNNVYGNYARVKVGYNSLDYNDYYLVYSGLIESVSISEDSISLSVSDRRKSISKSVAYSCTDKNALDAIVELLQLQFTNLVYNSSTFNTTNWDAATLLAPNITLVGDADNPLKIIDIIEQICVSVFGNFIIDPDGRYNFKLIDDSASWSAEVDSEDIQNQFEVNYDPSEIVSSVKVLYAQTGSSASVYIDTSAESAAYLKYRVYNQQEFDTCLVDATAATSFATTILNYSKDIRGRLSIMCPMEYYTVAVGDVIVVKIDRETTDMLGFNVCEVLGKIYNLANGFIQFDLRILRGLAVRVTTGGLYRIVSDSAMRGVEV